MASTSSASNPAAGGETERRRNQVSGVDPHRLLGIAHHQRRLDLHLGNGRDMVLRKQLVREQASHVQRIRKTLEDGHLKLTSVLTNIMGVSGRAILLALIDGERDPDTLLTLVQRGVKAPAEKLRAALQGRIADRHRFL